MTVKSESWNENVIQIEKSLKNMNVPRMSIKVERKSKKSKCQEMSENPKRIPWENQTYQVWNERKSKGKEEKQLKMRLGKLKITKSQKRSKTESDGKSLTKSLWHRSQDHTPGLHHAFNQNCHSPNRWFHGSVMMNLTRIRKTWTSKKTDLKTSIKCHGPWIRWPQPAHDWIVF